jgi:hypothetical protein
MKDISSSERIRLIVERDRKKKERRRNHFKRFRNALEKLGEIGGFQVGEGGRRNSCTVFLKDSTRRWLHVRICLEGAAVVSIPKECLDELKRTEEPWYLVFWWPELGPIDPSLDDVGCQATTGLVFYPDDVEGCVRWRTWRSTKVGYVVDVKNPACLKRGTGFVTLNVLLGLLQPRPS